MTDDHLAETVQLALSQLNPRRFQILLVCIKLGEEFTTTGLREALPDSDASLPRDLNALETAGLLCADPPRTSARQGRPVTYTVAERTRTVFRDLADVVDAAYASSPAPSAI